MSQRIGLQERMRCCKQSRESRAREEMRRRAKNRKPSVVEKRMKFLAEMEQIK